MIQVLCTNIAGGGQDLYAALYTASSEERKQRADQYVKREDSLRCLAAGALLRYALGTSGYTVEYNPQGKPRIKGNETFHYNLSHSGSWVAIAFGDTEVGVDVELRPWDAAAEKVTRRCFSKEEQDYVLEKEEGIQERFLRVWTGKESYLKYLGTGLRRPMNTVTILSPEPGIHYTSWTMPDGACLTLCATEPQSTFAMIDVRHLVL